MPSPIRYVMGINTEHLGDILTQFYHHGVVLVDQQEQIVIANEIFTNTINGGGSSLKGKPIRDFIHMQNHVAECYDRLSKNSAMDNLNQSNTVRWVNREDRLCHSAYWILQLEPGPLYLIMVKDMTEDESHPILQDFMYTFLKDVNLGVILFDTDFYVIEISDMACKVLGVNQSQILYRRLDEVFLDLPVQYQLVRKTLLDGIVVRNHAISWTNNNNRYELLMDTNLLRDRNGVQLGAYLMFKDVTNLRSLEEQMQRSDRLSMIGQIAAGTAHEIRNPLTSIKGFMQLLHKSMDERGLDKERQFTEIMLTEIDRINALVSEFLLLSKPKHIEYGPVDVQTVLREILPIINHEAVLHNVTINYKPVNPGQLPNVIANNEMLKQVFLNLCKNGIEAMPAGGNLTVLELLDSKKQMIDIQIQDTGQGIAPYLMDKIFDPFFTTKETGTGLGLPVCQRIIHDIGGSIRVSSKGFGTTFTISIPYEITKEYVSES